MTAEIAVLNKMAVALAADSAVTLSSGVQQQKIFDTADKLFDLCSDTPIGIMIYNGMQFMQAPLPMLIADFRGQVSLYERVPDAASAFLRFLSKWGAASPAEVSDESIVNIVTTVLEQIKARINVKIKELLKASEPHKLGAKIQSAVVDTIEVFERIFSKGEHAKFLGPDGETETPQITEAQKAAVRTFVESQFKGEKSANIERLTQIACDALLSDRLSGGETGIVFAGFGQADTFPTLVSYEIDGMVFGRLKFVETNFVDIDRNGPRAKVIPFAQKEMVERFLYGLDEDIERNIAQFCKATVPAISKQLVDVLDMVDEDRAALIAKADEAQDAFIEELKKSSFAEIRSQSKSEIEDMVEFMPKPDLATMAEALVNLTSIKRKVSRGMETVGGPVDVAVISRSEGFIWVKRKHYFSAELNPRYFRRVQRKITREQDHDEKVASAPDRKARKRRSSG